MNNDFLTNYRSISEVSSLVGVPQYVLRFWESKFSNIVKPTKNNNRRCYSEKDIESLCKIKFLLYDKGYSIKGAQNFLNSSQEIDDNENIIVNDPKKEVRKNMENLIELEKEQPKQQMQTQLEKLVAAASSEILFKESYQNNFDKSKLKVVLEMLYRIKSKLINI